MAFTGQYEFKQIQFTVNGRALEGRGEITIDPDTPIAEVVKALDGSVVIAYSNDACATLTVSNLQGTPDRVFLGSLAVDQFRISEGPKPFLDIFFVNPFTGEKVKETTAAFLTRPSIKGGGAPELADFTICLPHALLNESLGEEVSLV